jgi:hypothetical protein
VVIATCAATSRPLPVDPDDQHHRRQRDPQGAPIEMHFVDARNHVRHAGERKAETQAREGHAREPSQAGQDEPFDHELAREAQHAGAQRHAHRRLALPSGRACEQQVRDVEAAGQQDQADRGQEQVERGPRVAHELLVERDEENPAATLVVGIRRGQARRDPAHLLLRLLQGDAGTQAAQDAQPVVAALGAPARVDGQRHPQVDLQGMPRGRAHDAHDRVIQPVDPHRRAHDARIGPEAAPPERFVQHGHVGLAGRVLPGSERPAQQGPRAQHLEELGRDRRGRRAHRPVGLAQADAHSRVRGQPLEHIALLAPVAQVGRRRGALDVRRVGGQARGPERLPDLDQPLGLRERQGTQQHGIHQAEYCGGGADAQCHGGDGHDGESGLLRQPAQRVVELAAEAGHGHLPPP